MNASAGKIEQDTSGFIVAMAPSAARRQLNISLAVAGAFFAATLLTLAIAHLQPGLTGPAGQKPANIKLTIEMPGLMKMHQASSTEVEALAQPQRGI